MALFKLNNMSKAIRKEVAAIEDHKKEKMISHSEDKSTLPMWKLLIFAGLLIGALLLTKYG
jgi:hypothetical protein